MQQSDNIFWHNYSEIKNTKTIQWATLVTHRFLRPHIFFTKMLESNILYDNLLIDILYWRQEKTPHLKINMNIS